MGCLKMSIRGRVIRAALPVLLAPIALSVILGGAFLGGCAADDPLVHTNPDGPPPEGYDTWEDYWAAKDADDRKFEHDIEVQRMKQPRVPGMP